MSSSTASIVFCPDFARKLSDYRLPSTYIGVRRVRPSNSTVHTVMTAGPKLIERHSVQFTVTENGVERRMTSKEKKRKRAEMKEMHKQARKQARKEYLEQRDRKETTTKRRKKTSLEEVKSTLEMISESNTKYVSFKVDPKVLEQEIADLKGERDGVPPVALAPSMSRLLPGRELDLKVVIDDDLANRWAVALKASMEAAESIRRAEDMRAMVYDLIPEVWSRFRPEALCTSDEMRSEQGDVPSESQMAAIPIRPPVTVLDEDIAAAIQALHVGSNLHVSCGAKFGSDFLIYSGRRDETHAFAGLRVVQPRAGEEFPLPQAYECTGYVRCLNTAAKIALLAFVKREKQENGAVLCRVAFIDLSLVKIRKTLRDK